MAAKNKAPLYEGSRKDLAEDRRGAKKRGVSLKEYENTAQDRAEDRKGQAKMGPKKK
jgi:hypothetical protein